MVWRAEDPQGNEAAKIRWELVEYTNGKGLDLGCGPFKAFSHFTGVDNGAEKWGTAGADVVVETCADLSTFDDGSQDFVFSSHLLEHMEDPKAALKEWCRVIKDGGFLCLYLPHEDLYPKVGEYGANPDHKFNLNESVVERWMMSVGPWDMVRCDRREEGTEYSFFMVFKLGGKGFRYTHKKTYEKTCAIIRYGAFGDLLQMSSILPQLKDEGYRITVYTTDSGREVVKNDPHIDEFIIQGKDQVENERLGEFWASIKKRYTKFINLSESVEATLLAIPGRMNHSWPINLRRKYMDINYVEFAHDIAGVKHKPAPRFYPTKDEAQWAINQKKAYGGTVILWSLAGSSVHKTWPWLDQVVARLCLNKEDIRIVLVGDQACQMLEVMEEPLNSDPRIIKKSGIWTIRQSLAFAQVADLVVGPETGLLNGVSAEPVPKIVTLSHSSVNNLTRDWINCTSLIPKTACHPCHQLHYSFEFCHQDSVTGVAQCQADIGPNEMYDAITHWIEKCPALAA